MPPDGPAAGTSGQGYRAAPAGRLLASLGQVAFEEALEEVGVFDLSGYGPRPGELLASLATNRWSIDSFELVRRHLDDDIGAGIDPIREADGFNLYLITEAEHCITFTRGQESATGLVLAEVTED